MNFTVVKLEGHYDGQMFNINVGHIPKNRYVNNIDVILKTFNEYNNYRQKRSLDVLNNHSWSLRVVYEQDKVVDYTINSDGSKLEETLNVGNIGWFTWNPVLGSISERSISKENNYLWNARVRSVIFGNRCEDVQTIIDTITNVKPSVENKQNPFSIIKDVKSFEELSKNPEKVTLVGFNSWNSKRILMTFAPDGEQIDDGVREAILKQLQEYKVDVNLPYYNL